MWNAFLEGLMKVLLWSPLYACYGLYALVRSSFRLLRTLRRGRAALAESVLCPNGHRVRVIGRYACASCRAEYVGWVGRCPVCGAGASWTPCTECNVAIPLPWEDR